MFGIYFYDGYNNEDQFETFETMEAAENFLKETARDNLIESDGLCDEEPLGYIFELKKKLITKIVDRKEN